MDNKSATMQVRRYNQFTSAFNTDYIHLRNPWVTPWWSAAFPGFGHIHLGVYLKGFILFFWEIIINVNAKINLAMVYSFTGLGSLYIHRMPSGFFAVSWTAVILYFSHFLEALQYTFMGSFDQAIAVLDPEWCLFLPSIYCFAAYEAYILAVELNKLYKKE